MPPRILFVTAVVAALAANVLSGCSREDAPATTPKALRLGALVPLSGRSAQVGTTMVTAFEMAVKEANGAGGVLGHRVELTTGDDACDPGTAVSKANELVARDITVSVGGLCSAATVPTLKVFRASGFR